MIIDVSNRINKHEVNYIIRCLELAYRFIWMKIIIIQYILLDFINESPLEVIDCRTKEGQTRYIELYGLNKFKAKARVYGTEIISNQFQEKMILSKSLIQALFNNLNERSRRLVDSFLALSITTRNKMKLSKFLNIDPKTIAKGIKELLSGSDVAKGKIRRNGGGRKTLKQIYPDLDNILEDVVSDHVAGDPMTHRRWIRKSLSFFKEELAFQNVKISPSSIRKYFKKLNISLKENLKTISTQHYNDRDLQFKQINRIKKGFLKSGSPVISVDAKKKEKIGLFKNVGRSWKKIAKKVLDHDFQTKSTITITPFGVYDIRNNKGYVYCNDSYETSEYVVDMITKWWDEIGKNLYLNKKKLLILCDAGGANGYRRKGWKYELQERLASKFQIDVTVCHYPPGASKWDPIEHRLFSAISVNWAGIPLDSIETMLNLIRNTTNKTGLTIESFYIGKSYEKGKKYSDEDMDKINIEHWPIVPDLTYTIHP